MTQHWSKVSSFKNALKEFFNKDATNKFQMIEEGVKRVKLSIPEIEEVAKFMAEAKLENFDNVRKILPICVTLHQLYDNFARKRFKLGKKFLQMKR